MRNWIAAAGAAALASCQTAQVAEVAIPTDTICNWMWMYGNASASGLCVNLSPATQTQWVCELSKSPDIHTTFNATTQLHVTVRESGCVRGGSSYVQGMWPNLEPQPGQPRRICGVNVADYVSLLNGVPRTYDTIRSAFTAAQGSQRILPEIAHSYMAKARVLNCPNR